MSNVSSSTSHSTFKPLARGEIAYLVANDFPDGSVVNLGIGMPTQVADYLPADREILLHSENGILGMGRASVGDEIDLDIINASHRAHRFLCHDAWWPPRLFSSGWFSSRCEW